MRMKISTYKYVKESFLHVLQYTHIQISGWAVLGEGRAVLGEVAGKGPLSLIMTHETSACANRTEHAGKSQGTFTFA